MRHAPTRGAERAAYMINALCLQYQWMSQPIGNTDIGKYLFNWQLLLPTQPYSWRILAPCHASSQMHLSCKQHDNRSPDFRRSPKKSFLGFARTLCGNFRLLFRPGSLAAVSMPRISGQRGTAISHMYGQICDINDTVKDSATYRIMVPSA